MSINFLHTTLMEEATLPGNDAADASDAEAGGGTGAGAIEVMSEVHLCCPPSHRGLYTSRFTFRYPLPVDSMICSHQSPEVDADGDLIVTRGCRKSNIGVTIQHKITSSIPGVGLQIWTAALALSDFVLHTMHTSGVFQNVIVLELGAGTGLVGILLSQVAKTVYITDCGMEVLENCLSNVELNSGLFRCSRTSVYVKELNWIKSWPPPMVEPNSVSREAFLWTSSEIQEAERAMFIFAADVVYHDNLTKAFFHTIKHIMSQGTEKVLYLALEKRYNFTLNELDVVANGYSYFRSFLRDEEECRKNSSLLPCFVGHLLELDDIPQYVLEYDRGKDLEIWVIKYISSCRHIL